MNKSIEEQVQSTVLEPSSLGIARPLVLLAPGNNVCDDRITVWKQPEEVFQSALERCVQRYDMLTSQGFIVKYLGCSGSSKGKFHKFTREFEQKRFGGVLDLSEQYPDSTIHKIPIFIDGLVQGTGTIVSENPPVFISPFSSLLNNG